MVTGSGPSLRIEMTSPSGLSRTRRIDRVSTGGAAGSFRRSAGLNISSAATTIPSSTSGIRIAAVSRAPVAGVRSTEWATPASGLTASLHRFEHPHPAQFREFALMRVEHELARVTEFRLEDDAFTLAHHDGVGVIVGGLPRAGAIHIEEHGVQMQ